MNLKIFLAFIVLTVLYTEDFKKKLKPFPTTNIQRKRSLSSIVSLFWMIFWGLYFYYIYNHFRDVKLDTATLGQEILALEDRSNVLV